MPRKFVVVLACAALALAGSATAQERLLGVDGTKLMEIDPKTAQATQIATLDGGGTVGALAYDARTDTLFLASSSLDQLFTLDYKSGHVTLIGAFNRPGIDPVMHGLEIDASTGRLYGVDYRDKALVEIDKNTGQATMIGVTPLTGFGSMAWDAGRGVMFGGDSGTDSLWTIDLKSGVGTLVGPFNAPTAGSLGTGMAWSPNHGIIGQNNSGTDSLWAIDANTGAATLIGEPGTGNMLGIAFIPEPATGLCLLALAMFRRR